MKSRHLFTTVEEVSTRSCNSPNLYVKTAWSEFGYAYPWGYTAVWEGVQYVKRSFISFQSIHMTRCYQDVIEIHTDCKFVMPGKLYDSSGLSINLSMYSMCLSEASFPLSISPLTHKMVHQNGESHQ